MRFVKSPKIDELMANTPNPLCICGCGEKIVLKRKHFWKNCMPKFIKGHSFKQHNRESKLRGQKNIVFCSCGCGKSRYIKPSRQGKHNFYSKKCHAKFKTIEKAIVKCNWCGKNIEKYFKDILKHNFCNSICKSLWLRGENSFFWRGGKSLEEYGKDFTKQIKRETRDRDNNTCGICKLTEEQLCHTLNIHHVDYNKKNNVKSNYICLCRSCHMATNFNRNYWQKELTKLMEASGKNELL